MNCVNGMQLCSLVQCDICHIPKQCTQAIRQLVYTKMLICCPSQVSNVVNIDTINKKINRLYCCPAQVLAVVSNLRVPTGKCH